MDILHLATWDGFGAGRATTRLHEALRGLGHRSRMLVVYRQSQDPDVVAFTPDNGRWARFRRRLRRRRIYREFSRYDCTRPRDAWMFSDDRTEHAAALIRQLPQCQVLNLHAVARMIDHEHFFRHLPPELPVVWRLPEMSPFTGGCHYSEGCDRFASRCGACPQLGSADDDDLSRQIWERKRRSFERLLPRLHLVAPSRWIAEQARRSSLLGSCPVTVIPNGLEIDSWTPGDRIAIRQALGIPEEAKVVLFVAAEMQNRLKGYAHLASAIGGLADLSGLFLLSVGLGRPEIPAIADAVPRLHLGKLTCDRLLRMAYNAADVYVMPSLEESFGQTAVEAMACGVPVVAFSTGGIADTVRPGKTGLLVPRGDADALRDAIALLVGDASMQAAMSSHCRQVAIEEYDARLQARRYEELYLRLLPGSQRPAACAAIDRRTALGDPPLQHFAATDTGRGGP